MQETLLIHLAERPDGAPGLEPPRERIRGGK
jgi:hypothetical protein